MNANKNNPVLKYFLQACSVLLTKKEEVKKLSSVSSLIFCRKTQDYLNSRSWMFHTKNHGMAALIIEGKG